MALVLMMTIPGLGLFYGGMVRKKNVLGTLAQSFAVTCLVTVLWFMIGYTLAFTDGGSFVGDLSRLFLHGMGKTTTSGLSAAVPESVFMSFQMTFAIITPALIAGAFADRMNAKAKHLGRARSHFANPHGLQDPGQKMTVRDIATLSRGLIHDFPEYYHYFSEKEYTFNGIKQGNRNPLIYTTHGADGMNFAIPPPGLPFEGRSSSP